MRSLAALLVCVLLAGCATSGGVTTLADGRSGSFPILTSTFPTRPGAVEQPGTVMGELSLPAGSERVPAVIVLHPCAGVTPNVTAWATELNRMGYAALVIDSFTRRGVEEICTGHASVSVGSRLADVFRAQELLVTHPRIEPRRIGVLGFSHGGWVALWASQSQYQRRFMRGTGAPPAAYAAFYPVGCNARLVNEADMAGGPVRIFHGTADDWTTIDHCRDWVARRRAAGKDVSIVEYDGALHAFDVGFFAKPQRFPEVVNPSGCRMIQQADGTFVDDAGKPFSGASPCMTRGASMGYDARAHQRSIADLKAFFGQAFEGR
ncbi:MAG TPA: dienelactone hydrolase family protein [Patescibacteria group bacterium]|nr:dienelactone hydrolase family protein [Patescibacteria group bacterium]